MLARRTFMRRHPADLDPYGGPHPNSTIQPAQKISFRPACILRAAAEPVILPKVEFPKVVSGLFRFTLFSALNISHRNCTILPSTIAVFLKMERSQFCTP